jgi:aerobic-type carbon monoxide dehydrogenase small subunit (CoxS/CutS family)
MTRQRITLTVNGARAVLDVEPRMSLAHALRQMLGLTGTHLGCEHGICGACTILLDGHAVRSCLMLAVQAQDVAIITIEGVSPAAGLTPVQEAMRRHHAVQCGFCSPGMVLALEALFAATPCPTENDICEAISGNLCRCTGYRPIIDAALDLAAANRDGRTNSAPAGPIERKQGGSDGAARQGQ